MCRMVGFNDFTISNPQMKKTQYGTRIRRRRTDATDEHKIKIRFYPPKSVKSVCYIKHGIMNIRRNAADMKRTVTNMRCYIADMRRNIVNMRRYMPNMKRYITDMKCNIADIKRDIVNIKWVFCPAWT